MGPFRGIPSTTWPSTPLPTHSPSLSPFPLPTAPVPPTHSHLTQGLMPFSCPLTSPTTPFCLLPPPLPTHNIPSPPPPLHPARSHLTQGLRPFSCPLKDEPRTTNHSSSPVPLRHFPPSSSPHLPFPSSPVPPTRSHLTQGLIPFSCPLKDEPSTTKPLTTKKAARGSRLNWRASVAMVLHCQGPWEGSAMWRLHSW